MTSTSSSSRWLRSSEKKHEEKENQKKESVDEDVSAVEADCTFIDRGKEAGQEPLQKLEFIYRFQRPNVCCVCECRFSQSPLSLASPSRSEQSFFPSASSSRKRKQRTEEIEEEAEKKRKQAADTVVEFSARDLENLCMRHESWLAPNSTQDDIEQFAEDMIERMQSGDFRKYRRICKPCFEATIVSNVFDRASALAYENDTLHVSCPVCPASRRSFIRAERVMPFLSEQNRKRVRQGLEQELLLRQNIVLYCPVLNCTHRELIPKKVPAFSAPLAERMPKVVSCSEHGKHCVNCWNPVANDAKQHQCKALPKEVIKSRLKNKIRRCTLCNVAIEKNGGCHNMVCVCGGRFDWDTAALPTQHVMRLDEEEI